ncbi:MAG: tRNA (N6-isopentenyl adenosine(37)-C2)-methylthiotransferase MiaB [Bacilli bacterium]
MKTKIINTPDLLKASNRKKENTEFVYNAASYSKEHLDFIKDKKVFIRTYGCQANVRDEEYMLGQLLSLSALKVDEEKDADIIIINTCAVRENAEDKVYGEIGNLKNLYLKNKNLIIAITGCMIEQPEILDFILNTFPYVKLYLGTHELHNLVNYLYDVSKNNERIIAVESKQGEVIEDDRVSRSNRYKAFVNVIYGCNKFCTYCIVPYTRGKERSRKFNEVIKECQTLIDQGYKEITLLGQNVNAYGKDLDEGKDFADLLEAVAKLNIPRLRFTTSHPWDFSKKMVDVIAKYDNIMKFIHLPVQSGNNEILKKMGRRYTKEQYLDLVKYMKEKIPSLNLSTDIIVGFPNESEEQFLDTIDLVNKVQYDSAFTFIYSPRKGTPAARMEDNVPYKEKSRRFMKLVNALEVSISNSSNSMVGHTYDVLVDGYSKTDNNKLSGYTENNKLVHFEGDISLVGQIVKVKIKESHTYSLLGELVNE